MNPVAGSREGDDETPEKTIRAVVPPVGGLVVGGTRRAAVYTANRTPVTGRLSQRAGAALPVGARSGATTTVAIGGFCCTRRWFEVRIGRRERSVAAGGAM
ncbi:hypothetical protein MFTT_60850 [Mycolicibacterium fortuitum subsp. fortuitum]|nr:hypothetical protein MFTT_60850 [Mycolicibacterium fortuitum subsp. fortuitum]